MKKLLLFINTVLITLVIGFTGFITLGFLVDDINTEDLVIWIITLGFSGLILFPLIIWRKNLKKSNTLNSNTSQKTQNDIPKSSVKKEDVETKKSDESILDDPKISESPKEEFESEDKEKVLSDFIELCILGGELTDKKKEVVLRKSNELGIPEDECEIMIDSILYKMKNQ